MSEPDLVGIDIRVFAAVPVADYWRLLVNVINLIGGVGVKQNVDGDDDADRRIQVNPLENLIVADPTGIDGHHWPIGFRYDVWVVRKEKKQKQEDRSSKGVNTE